LSKGVKIVRKFSEGLEAWILLNTVCLLVAIASCTAGPAEKAAPIETPEPGSAEPLTWYSSPGNILQQAAEFYNSAEAIRIAETVLLYQSDNGGWPKNYDRIAELSESEKQLLFLAKGDRDNTTFDNGSTHSEVQFLVRVHQATGDEHYKEAALKGIDFMLAAQYENGGWPQTYPRYSNHITYNDDAMIGVMTVLHDIAAGDELYSCVDKARREKAALAVEKGIDCILQTQIVVDRKLTAWCAQHDRRTLEPQQARAYEHPSISGSESVGIVRFLMSIEDPSPEVIAAIKGAVAWFEGAKLTGIRVDKIADDSLFKGYDLVVVEDETAPPLWARFYEIDTNKPFYADRDGSIKESLADLSHERRVGYNWLTDRPALLLSEEYPAWKQAHPPKTDNTLLYVILALIACVVLCGAIVWLFRHVTWQT
jgi:PelA/Pel-15E family pectate lyase